MSEITGLRSVLVSRIEPGLRSVVDVMTKSGSRVTANVRHGSEVESAIASMMDEVSSSRGTRDLMKGDPDFEAIMEIVIRLMAHGGDIIDVVAPLEPRTFMRRLIVSHVEAAWKGLHDRGVEYEDALEGIRRFFS